MPDRTSVAPMSSPATWQTATVRPYLSVVTRRHSTGRAVTIAASARRASSPAGQPSQSCLSSGASMPYRRIDWPATFKVSPSMTDWPSRTRPDTITGPGNSHSSAACQRARATATPARAAMRSASRRHQTPSHDAAVVRRRHQPDVLVMHRARPHPATASGGLPRRHPAGDLRVRHVEVEGALPGIDDDRVAVAHRRDRAALAPPRARCGRSGCRG